MHQRIIGISLVLFLAVLTPLNAGDDEKRIPPGTPKYFVNPPAGKASEILYILPADITFWHTGRFAE